MILGFDLLKIIFQVIKVKMRFGIILFVNFVFLFLSYPTNPVLSQETEEISNLDEKVKRFLKSYKGRWVDLNVPESDGKVLYDLIIKNKYKKAIQTDWLANKSFERIFG